MIDSPITASPHAHGPTSVQRTMLLVTLALVPATLFGLYQFGWPAIFLFTVTIGSALAFEALSLLLAGRGLRAELFDGSALLTGWILALTLPPWAPWWIGVMGGFLAVVLGKQVFGGIGQNLFNPAMVARVALLVAFPLEMTRFVAPHPMFSVEAPGLMQSLSITFGALQQDAVFWDAMSGASILGRIRTELAQGANLGELLPLVFDPVKAMLGQVPGSLGETSAMLLAAGGVFLIAKRVIGWTIPLAFLGTITVLAAVTSFIAPERFAGPLYHLLTGATMLCAFFIATDPVTSPIARTGQVLFAVGIGALVWVIRTFGGYAEGVAYAVLLMNACTPLIDHYIKPRVYGRDRRGKPIEYPLPDTAPAPAPTAAPAEKAR